MSNNTIEFAIQRIKELLDQGTVLKIIRAHLVIEDYPNSVIEAAIKELGLSTKAKKGFAAEYYDWLATTARDKDEAEKFIMGEGEYGETTGNIKKHKSHYLSIWELTIRVYATLGYQEESSDSAEDINPEVKAAWDKLNKARDAWKAGGKKPRRTTFHPDKVEVFGDESLIKAYKEFFQELS